MRCYGANYVMSKICSLTFFNVMEYLFSMLLYYYVNSSTEHRTKSARVSHGQFLASLTLLHKTERPQEHLTTLLLFLVQPTRGSSFIPHKCRSKSSEVLNFSKHAATATSDAIKSQPSCARDCRTTSKL